MCGMLPMLAIYIKSSFLECQFATEFISSHLTYRVVLDICQKQKLGNSSGKNCLLADRNLVAYPGLRDSCIASINQLANSLA